MRKLRNSNGWNSLGEREQVEKAWTGCENGNQSDMAGIYGKIWEGERKR